MENEKFNILPGRIYVKGFLKNYARYLDLSPETLVMAFDEQFPEDNNSQADNHSSVAQEEPATEKLRVPQIYRRLAAGAAAVALLFVLGSALFNSLGEAPSETKPPVANEQGQQQAGQNQPGDVRDNNQPNTVPPPPETIPRAQGVNVALNVTASTCWMQVVVDGKDVFIGEVPAGQVKTFNGKDKIMVRLGNAGVVEVNYNGQNIGFLGERGKVVNREFTST